MQQDESNKEPERFSEESVKNENRQNPAQDSEPQMFGFLDSQDSRGSSFLENKFARIGIALVLGLILIGSGYAIMTFYVTDPPKKTGRFSSGNLKSGNPFQGHEEKVLSVAFSPDGSIMASASVDKTIQFFKYLETNKPYATLTGHKNPVNSIAFSPDGKLFASGSDDGEVKLWDVSGGKEIAVLPHRSTIAKIRSDYPFSVKTIAFSPDGKYLASGGTDGNVVLWNLENKQPEKVFDDYYMIWSIAFSPDGKTLASAGEGAAISLWNTENGKLIFKMEDSELNVSLYAVAFSPDGTMLVSGARTGKVMFWNVKNGERIWASTELKPHEMNFHKDAVVTMAFTSKNKLLITGSYDGTVKLWDIDRGGTLNTIRMVEVEGLYGVCSVAFSPNGADLAIGDANGGLLVYEIKDEWK